MSYTRSLISTMFRLSVQHMFMVAFPFVFYFLPVEAAHHLYSSCDFCYAVRFFWLSDLVSP